MQTNGQRNIKYMTYVYLCIFIFKNINWINLKKKKQKQKN